MDLKEMNAQLGKVELYLRKAKDQIVESLESEEDDLEEGCVGEGCEDGEDEEEDDEEEEEDDGEDEEE